MFKWIASIAVCAFLCSCSGNQTMTSDNVSTEKVSVQKTDNEIPAWVLEKGNSVTDALMSTLKQELQAGMKEGGALGAVEVCATQALVLTKSIADSDLEVESIKRTSMKFRNPKNAPDELNKEALAYLETHPDENQYVQQGNDEYAGYYIYNSRITVKKPCETCHGNKLKQELLDLLSNRYPDDKATGYTSGDFRGIVAIYLRKPVN